jgi:hypothetical protein
MSAVNKSTKFSSIRIRRANGFELDIIEFALIKKKWRHRIKNSISIERCHKFYERIIYLL